jgi:hypothetical protein
MERRRLASSYIYLLADCRKTKSISSGAEAHDCVDAKVGAEAPTPGETIVDALESNFFSPQHSLRDGKGLLG